MVLTMGVTIGFEHVAGRSINKCGLASVPKDGAFQNVFRLFVLLVRSVVHLCQAGSSWQEKGAKLAMYQTRKA